jgi:hypothetical protein
MKGNTRVYLIERLECGIWIPCKGPWYSLYDAISGRLLKALRRKRKAMPGVLFRVGEYHLNRSLHGGEWNA